MEVRIGNQGLVPPSQDTWAVSQLLFQSRGVQGSASGPAANTGGRAAQHTLPLTTQGLWCLKTPMAQGWVLDLGL